MSKAAPPIANYSYFKMRLSFPTVRGYYITYQDLPGLTQAQRGEGHVTASRQGPPKAERVHMRSLLLVLTLAQEQVQNCRNLVPKCPKSCFKASSATFNYF